MFAHKFYDVCCVRKTKQNKNNSPNKCIFDEYVVNSNSYSKVHARYSVHNQRSKENYV